MRRREWSKEREAVVEVIFADTLAALTGGGRMRVPQHGSGAASDTPVSFRDWTINNAVKFCWTGRMRTAARCDCIIRAAVTSAALDSE